MTSNNQLIYKDLKLSIVLSVDSFFYMLIDKSGSIVSEGEFSDLSDGAEAVKGFSKLVHKSIITYKGTPFTHVPYDDFNAKYLKDYLHSVAFLNDAWSLEFEKVAKLPIFTCYAIENRILNIIKTIPGNHEIKHISSCLMKQFIADKKKQIICIVDKGTIQILSCREGKLKFYNQYKAKSEKDILYFIMLVYKELELSRESDTLWLAGNITKDSKLYDSIYQYVRNVDFVNISSNLNTNNQKPSHYYLDAYASSLCAL